MMGASTTAAGPTVEIVKKTDSPWAGINADSGNLRVDGYNGFTLMAPYATSVHLKSHIAGADGSRRKPIGAGCLRSSAPPAIAATSAWNTKTTTLSRSRASPASCTGWSANSPHSRLLADYRDSPRPVADLDLLCDGLRRQIHDGDIARRTVRRKQIFSSGESAIPQGRWPTSNERHLSPPCPDRHLLDRGRCSRIVSSVLGEGEPIGFCLRRSESARPPPVLPRR